MEAAHQGTVKIGHRLGWTQMTEDSPLDLQGDFVAAYIKVFAGDPYFEKYEFEEVFNDILGTHLRDGIVVGVLDLSRDNKLIGFGCALPFEKCPDDVKGFLEDQAQAGNLPADFNFRQAWYMSELGVLKEYREQGIALDIVKQRARLLRERGCQQYFMRTAAKRSKSKSLYLKAGSREIGVIQDVSQTNQATENMTQSLERVYLWGDCDYVVMAVDQIRSSSDCPRIDPL